MTDTKSHLTLLPGGEKKPATELSLATFRKLPANKRIDALISQPNPAEALAAIPLFDLYLTVKSAGALDAAILLPCLTPEQMCFCMDMELWQGYTFSAEGWDEWLPLIVEGGERAFINFLHSVDRELLQLILIREIAVGGGVGDLSSDEERLAEWDHTFDNLYFITFLNKTHATLMGQFLNLLYTLDNYLYLHLMEAVKAEVETEVEDYCSRFRLGRLADLGFPEPLEAASIYAPLDTATFSPAQDKEFPPQAVSGDLLPSVPVTEGTLLARALARGVHPFVIDELNYLVNCAMVSEVSAFGDTDLLQNIMERVHGRITIALEQLTGDDEAAATALLEHEYIKNLFRFGNSLIDQVRKTAAEVHSTDYPTTRLLKGLLQKHPRYYRALDKDGIDGYREFRDMADLNRIRDFLAALI